MPPFLLRKGEIIFRPTWQIQSKPVVFILLWAIKYQILLGSMQSSSSILLSVIAHNSKFSSGASSPFLHSCSLSENKENREKGASGSEVEGV